MRNFRLYRIVRVAIVIAITAFRYWWLQKRNAPQEKWDRVHAKTGAAIFRLATKLGGALVKVGQVMGARADALPAAFVAPLRGLHDKVPARPFEKLREHVERELGADVDAVFASVEPTAIAAASLAQVHRAKLVTGEDVVIKIQYPEARRLFPIDLGSLRRAVRVARWLDRTLDLRALADELAEFVGLELDFLREAESTERIRENFAADVVNASRVVVPRVHRKTGKILVLELLRGTPLSALDKLREQSVDLRDVARRVAGLYATMIFEHGFFHGDPHPGNILVLDDGRIGLLDFGLAKELPPGFGAAAAKMIASAMAGNAPATVDAARAIGFVIADDLAPELLGLVRTLMGDYKDAGAVLQNVRRGRLEVPSHFTLIIRVLVILSGLSHSLVPNERVIAGALVGALAPHLKAS